MSPVFFFFVCKERIKIMAKMSLYFFGTKRTQNFVDFFMSINEGSSLRKEVLICDHSIHRGNYKIAVNYKTDEHKLVTLNLTM